MVEKPLISIITIVYNQSAALRETINSVINQSFLDMEYLIIDGNSNDGTKNVIREFSTDIDFAISEPDKGISDAFNKGIEKASGEYILLLNAGDTFLDREILKEIAPRLNEPIVTFRFRLANKPKISDYINPDSNVLKRALVGHQCTFVKKKVYEEWGGYDPKFKIRMDYDFFLRVMPHYLLASHDQAIVIYDAGISGQFWNRMRYEIEGLIAEFLNLRKPNLYMFKVLFLPLYRTLNYGLRQFVKKIIGWDNIRGSK